MRMLSLAPLVLALGCAATGSTARTRPNLADRAFYEARTKHVTLVTDLSRDEADDQVRKLEELWLMLADHYELVAPGMSRPTESFHAIIFAHCRDFEVFALTDKTAGFVASSRDGQQRAIIVSCDRRDTPLVRLFLHELAHVFNHHFFAILPTWLEEGLATYYETLQIQADRAVIGELPLTAMAFRPQSHAVIVGLGDKGGRMPTLDELLEMRPGDFYGQAAGGGPARHYATAWALVHLLNSTQDLQDRFVLFLSRLAAAQPFDVAWAAVYGNLPRASLAQQLADYIRRDELNVWRARYTRPSTGRAEIRRLGVGETHGVWIHLLLMTQRDRDPAHLYAQLDYADAADPEWAGRHFWRAMAQDFLGGGEVDTLLRQAADSDPTDRVTLAAIVARAVADSDSSRLPEVTPYAESLEPRAKSGRELAALAMFWLRVGNLPRAMPLAVRSVQIERGCAYCYEALAMTLATTGKYEQAVDFQGRAVGLLERHERGGDSTAARERLERYQAEARQKR
jgi:hypothetical protein